MKHHLQAKLHTGIETVQTKVLLDWKPPVTTLNKRIPLIPAFFSGEATENRHTPSASNCTISVRVPRKVAGERGTRRSRGLTAGTWNLWDVRPGDAQLSRLTSADGAGEWLPNGRWPRAMAEAFNEGHSPSFSGNFSCFPPSSYALSVLLSEFRFSTRPSK